MWRGPGTAPAGMAGRTVRVHGFPAELPPDRAADKLTIHFLRSRNGGGDIAEVRVLRGSPPCALITFEAPEGNGTLGDPACPTVPSPFLPCPTIPNPTLPCPTVLAPFFPVPPSPAPLFPVPPSPLPAVPSPLILCPAVPCPSVPSPTAVPWLG